MATDCHNSPLGFLYAITAMEETSGICEPTVRVAIDSLGETLAIIQIVLASNKTIPPACQLMVGGRGLRKNLPKENHSHCR